MFSSHASSLHAPAYRSTLKWLKYCSNAATCRREAEWAKLPGNPGKPLKSPGLSLPLEKYLGKSWYYHPPLKNYVLKQSSYAATFGLAELLNFAIPVRLWRRIYQASGGRQYKMCCVANCLVSQQRRRTSKLSAE